MYCIYYKKHLHPNQNNFYKLRNPRKKKGKFLHKTGYTDRQKSYVKNYITNILPRKKMKEIKQYKVTKYWQRQSDETPILAGGNKTNITTWENFWNY